MSQLLNYNHFNNLPDEVIINIFSYFDFKDLILSVAPVCRRWWRLSKDEHLWTKLSVTVLSKRKLTGLCLAFQRCRLLNSLKVLSMLPLDSINHCFSFDFLKHLDLSHSKYLSENLFQHIAEKCPQIEILNLEFTCLSFNSIRHVVKLKHLASLNLNACSGINDACIKHIARNCQVLQLLNIDNVFGITDECICELVEQRGSSLGHLFLNGDDLTDKSMTALNACENLQTFGVSSSCHFSNDTFQKVALLSNLSWLKIGIDKCSPRVFENIFQNTRLKVLDINYEHMSDSDLHVLSTSCKNIRILSLSWCWNISDIGLDAVIRNCTMLTWLSLLDNGIVTGKSLLQIPEALPDLLFLNIEKPSDPICDVIVDLMIRMSTLNIYINGYTYELYLSGDTLKGNGEIAFLVDKHLHVTWNKCLSEPSGKLESLTLTPKFIFT